MEQSVDVSPTSEGERGSSWETRGAEFEESPWNSFRVLVRMRPSDKSDVKGGYKLQSWVTWLIEKLDCYGCGFNIGASSDKRMKKCVKLDGQRCIQINTGRGNQTQVLEFDAVLDEDASQRDVYEAIAKPLARRALVGFHGCVVTYGAPATGKTHSLYGTGLIGRQRGILSRAAEDIFQGIQKSNSGSTHRVVVSFIQLWNERLYDLLDHQHSERIRIHETDEAVALEGLTETEVTSVETLLKAFRKGMATRSAGISKGEIGSRSHTIFYITVVQTVAHTQQPQDATIITGRLTLVDLAGSGRVVRRGALGDSERGRRLFPSSGEDDINDAKNVNRSLTLLTNVIFALTTPGCQHIPYRESKLTRILRDCLGGSCCTALLVTLSAGAQAAHETHGALQLAARARTIACRPVRSVSMQVADTVDKSDVEGANITEQGLKRLSPAGQRSTSFPPIHPAPSPRPCDRNRSTLTPSVLPDDPGKELWKQGMTLPQLSERSPKPPKPTALGAEVRIGGLTPGEQSARARPPLGPTEMPESGREQRPPAKLERLVVAEAEGAQAPSQAALMSGPCSSCRRERRIREEYDKFIVQARRERDTLQERVAELERELCLRDVAPGHGDSARNGGGGGAEAELSVTGDVPWRSQLMGDGERDIQTDRRGAQRPGSEARGSEVVLKAMEQGECGAKARRDSSVEWHQGCEEKAQAAERAMAAAQKERDWLLVEVEELKSQLQHPRDVELSPAGGGGGGRLERELLSAELEELRAQLGKTREREWHKLATLEGEKEKLLQELQDARAEAGQLRGQMRQRAVDAAREKENLLAEIEKLNVKLQRMGAEAALLRGKIERMEMTSNSRPFLGPAPNLGQLDGSYMEGEYLEELSRAREALRQTRRERNLLLDVMSIMYSRRWFAPEATVHVRRTLQRCGVRSAQHD